MRRTMAILFAVAMVVGLAWWWYPREPASGLRYDLQPGDRTTYALSYESDHEVALPGVEGGGTLRARMRLDADVTVTVLARADDHWLLRWHMAEPRKVELGLGEEVDVARDEAPAMFADREVLVRLGFDGAVQEVLVDPGDPEPFRTVAKLMIAETQLPLLSDATTEWQVRELAGLGPVDASLRIDSRDADGADIEKSRGPYQELLALPWVEALDELDQEHEHQARIRFDGRVTALEDRAKLVVRDGDRVVFRAESELSWKLADHGHGDVPHEIDDLVAKREAVRLDEVPASPAAEAESWRQQAGDMTWPTLESYVRGFDGTRMQTATHDEFLWQAAGLLTMHPELCAELLPVFVDAQTSDEGRYLTLDVLAIVGHPTAQSVLRQALESEPARRDDAVYARLVQRLGRVEAPDVETARFALARYEEAEREHDRFATAHAVGSVVRKLPGASPERVALYGRLVDDLHRTTDVSVQAQLLRALSNAAADDNVPLALEYARSEAPPVRAAAALALRRVARTEAAGILTEMAADPDQGVQETALRSLREHDLDESVRDALGDEILAGRVHPRSYWAAYDLVRDFPISAARSELASYMATHAPDDPRLRSKLLVLARTTGS